jgi:pimeloyl-ACP methyl ester carboxylesterase
MLEKIVNPAIQENVQDIEIASDVTLHIAMLHHAEHARKTALYIHGSGTIGNHTIVERPSRWLIDQAIYGTVIMPDRRGCGASSSWTRKPTIRDQAQDMQDLLDALNIAGPLDVLGLSTGGPVALTLAHLDDRVQLVGLISSSPTLKQIAWPWDWLISSGLLPLLMKLVFRSKIGRAEPKYIDYDFMYDLENPSRRERWEHFREVLRHTPEERLDSVMYEFNATLDPANAEIPDDVRLDIPVLQVIGTEDETWGSEMPERYRKRFPNLRRRIISGADHGDALTRSDDFHTEFAEMLRTERENSGLSEPYPELVQQGQVSPAVSDDLVR